MCAQAWERRPLLIGLIEMPSGSGASDNGLRRKIPLRRCAALSPGSSLGGQPPGSRRPIHGITNGAASDLGHCLVQRVLAAARDVYAGAFGSKELGGRVACEEPASLHLVDIAVVGGGCPMR